MRKTLILFVFLSFSLGLFSQDSTCYNYFNKMYWADTLTSGSSAMSATVILERDTGYFALGTYAVEPPEKRYIYLRELNKLGESLSFTKPIEKNAAVISIRGQMVALSKDSSGYLGMHGDYKNANNTFDLDIHYFKLDWDGNILPMGSINSENRENPRTLISTNDNGFLIVGSHQVPGFRAYYYIAKIDSQGNVEWENSELGGQPGGNSTAFSALEKANGNFLIGGYAYFENSDYDSYVVEVNTTGEFVQDYQFANNGLDCAATISQLNNGNYLMTSCRINQGEYHHYFAELNLSLDIVWEKYHQVLPDLSSFWTKPIIKNNGHFIAVGRYENEAGWDQPAIIEADEQGEIVFVKPISPNPEKHVYVHDMRPTLDGGYIITGYEHAPSPQRSWVIKVDSLGNTCSTLGCDSIVWVIDSSNVDTNTIIPSVLWDNQRASSIQIAPNPAQDYFWLTHHLPQHYPKAEIHLYNVNGTLVKEQNFSPLDNPVNVQIGTLSEGIYYWQVLLGKEVVGSGALMKK